MPIIKPEIQYVDNFSITGFSTRTNNSDESNPNTARIPSLWQRFHASELANINPIYGVYSDYDSDASGSYTLTVGTSETKDKTNLSNIIIISGNYLVFTNSGPMPTTLIQTWHQIWDYFAQQSAYQRRFISDFELYEAPNQVAIYIGIR
ncbi:GyrI-like domain-containing protein [Legionella jamestowniensis]|uniref:Transcription activator n=1 Tax=Legionella jamestowniensis TaxID=455 RepID=A0A0W0UKZ7_9GAMM|nr:GyrI-like domain-containing protein [Legionella jamestowniensis]KTD08310.1 transcription activator [Legionella jamestowniensis]OCH97163.1 hypothetical protein A8135_05925 [Legionella jamestowniensis]SFL49565.1 Predicted transcriptional regulator YdeE, contains AraC-type DNA-binding domain [Legionella jamestowniensis DSM 19215]